MSVPNYSDDSIWGKKQKPPLIHKVQTQINGTLLVTHSFPALLGAGHKRAVTKTQRRRWRVRRKQREEEEEEEVY